jgi:hypothetical protein
LWVVVIDLVVDGLVKRRAVVGLGCWWQKQTSGPDGGVVVWIDDGENEEVSVTSSSGLLFRRVRVGGKEEDSQNEQQHVLLVLLRTCGSPLISFSLESFKIVQLSAPHLSKEGRGIERARVVGLRYIYSPK